MREEHHEEAEPRPQQASKYDKWPFWVEEKEELQKRLAEHSQPNGFISGQVNWAFNDHSLSSPGCLEVHGPKSLSWSPISLVEDEPCSWDKAPLSTAESCQDSLARRYICISNIVRGLSFVPGNNVYKSRHPGLMLILGWLVLLHHRPVTSRRSRDRPAAGTSGGGTAWRHSGRTP